MEIKVGEYIRTKYSIGKVENIGGFENELVYFKNCECLKCVEKIAIKKCSPNIIDLIEVGDVIQYKELFDNEKYGTKANETYILNLKSQKEVDKFKKCVEDKEIEFVNIVTKVPRINKSS